MVSTSERAKNASRVKHAQKQAQGALSEIRRAEKRFTAIRQKLRKRLHELQMERDTLVEMILDGENGTEMLEMD